MSARVALGVSCLALAAFACSALSVPAFPTASPTSRVNPGLLHFEDQWVAFDYPQGLDVYESLDPAFRWSLQDEVHVGGEQVAGLGDAHARANGVYLHSIRITHQGLALDEDVQQRMQELYRSFDGRYDTAGPLLAPPQTTIVDGAPAYQMTYRIFWGEAAYDFRDVWIPHGDALYIVSVLVRWSNPDAAAQFNVSADAVLQSFVIK